MKLKATQEVDVEINVTNFLIKLRDKLAGKTNITLHEKDGLFYMVHYDQTLVDPHVYSQINENKYNALKAIKALECYVSELKEEGISI